MAGCATGDSQPSHRSTIEGTFKGVEATPFADCRNSTPANFDQLAGLSSTFEIAIAVELKVIEAASIDCIAVLMAIITAADTITTESIVARFVGLCSRGLAAIAFGCKCGATFEGFTGS